MPLMPVAINTAVTGMYCLPLVSCVGFSVNGEGKFAESSTDFFDNPAWDHTRMLAQEKGIAMRSQGWSGAAMLPYGETGNTPASVRASVTWWTASPSRQCHQPAEAMATGDDD